MIEQVIDYRGRVRRMGSLPTPANFLSKYPTFSSVHPVMDDDEIRYLLTRPSRTPRRSIFGTNWKLDQGQFGSCNGFSLAGGFGKTRWLRGIQDGLLFSGAFSYSLMNNNRDNGSALEDGLATGEEIGLVPLSLCPFDQIYARLQQSGLKEIAQKRKLLNAYALNSLQEFKSAAAIGFMCIVAVHAGNNFMKVRNGLSGVDNGIGNHSILIQDIRPDGKRFQYDHDGSWGLDYGDLGNSWLVDEHLVQCIKHHQFYAIVSTVEHE